MAKKRMFSIEIIDSDKFMEMPVSSRELYFQLGLRGDDDGFIGNPRRIMRSIGAVEDDMNVLITKGFVHQFNSGVIVILDWQINNTLRNDRYNPTVYFEEKKSLSTLENKRYTIGIPDVNQRYPQHNITKHNITEHNITKQNEDVSVLAESYFKIFSDFTRGVKSQPRNNAVHEFSTLLPDQQQQAILGANNYIEWYKKTGKSIQYSINAFIFLKDMAFVDFQTVPDVVIEDKTNRPVKPAPAWSQSDYKETTSPEQQAEFEKYKKERKKGTSDVTN